MDLRYESRRTVLHRYVQKKLIYNTTRTGKCLDPMYSRPFIFFSYVSYVGSFRQELIVFYCPNWWMKVGTYCITNKLIVGIKMLAQYFSIYVEFAREFAGRTYSQFLYNSFNLTTSSSVRRPHWVNRFQHRFIPFA